MWTCGVLGHCCFLAREGLVVFDFWLSIPFFWKQLTLSLGVSLCFIHLDSEMVWLDYGDHRSKVRVSVTSLQSHAYGHDSSEMLWGNFNELNQFIHTEGICHLSGERAALVDQSIDQVGQVSAGCIAVKLYGFICVVEIPLTTWEVHCGCVR